MIGNYRSIIAGILTGSLAITPVFAEGRPVISVDPEIAGKTEAAIRTANQEANYPAALREGRRLLELYPNNPALQAPVYVVMSEAAQKTGDAVQSADFIATAKAIDPGIEIRLAAAPSGTATRGDPGSKWLTALTVITQGAQMAQQIQQQIQQQKLARLQQQPIPAQPQAPLAMAYPSAPVNSPIYQPTPTTNGPMPGWTPQQQQQVGVPPQYPPAPVGQAPYPPVGQPQYPPAPIGQAQYPPVAQPQYPPAPIEQALYPPVEQPQYPPPAPVAQAQYPPVGQPQYPPPAPVAQAQYPPVGQPQYPPPAPVAQAQYPPVGQPQYLPPAPVAQAQYSPVGQPQYLPPAGQPQYATQPGQSPAQPYAARNYRRPASQTRGEAPVVIKVVHDHYRVGDKAYFQDSCGALLSVDGNNLTFTASGGEGPVVIPAGDILEIRLNTTVGRSAGAFHIATKKGLYLNLVPESGKSDDGRADVDQLRKLLGLG